MKGNPITNYIPLHLSALDREPALKEWLLSFITPSVGKSKVEFLDYAGWFDRGHDIRGGKKNLDGVWIPHAVSGTFVWAPPPAAALLAVEQLRQAQLKCEQSTHFFLIPRLMMPEWRRQLFCVLDLFIELLFDDIWQQNVHHEPLIIAFVFPFLSSQPWQLKRSHTFWEWQACCDDCGKLIQSPSGLFCQKFHIHEIIGNHVRRHGVGSVTKHPHIWTFTSINLTMMM